MQHDQPTDTPQHKSQVRHPIHTIAHKAAHLRTIAEEGESPMARWVSSFDRVALVAGRSRRVYVVSAREYHIASGTPASRVAPADTVPGLSGGVVERQLDVKRRPSTACALN
jgi:hypothetical protein